MKKPLQKERLAICGAKAHSRRMWVIYQAIAGIIGLALYGFIAASIGYTAYLILIGVFSG